MKIIHCADLHLDSKLSANLSKEKRKQRKAEILLTFEKMVDYAARKDVTAILIAGDLFDTKTITKTVRNTVLSAIRSHNDIGFYYLRGNHDADNFLDDEEKPENLFYFDDNWTSYILGNEGAVVLYGAELGSVTGSQAATSLVPSADKFNIVMLHGQDAFTGTKDKTEIIPIKDFKNKGIDYMALGHIHSFREEKIDARGVYCYPGCLDGRGFDECGPHGFVLLDIDEKAKSCTRTFVPFASRTLYTVNVDVSGVNTTAGVWERIDSALNTATATIAAPDATTTTTRPGSTSLIKVVLTGTRDVESELDTDYIVTRLEQEFYFAKIYNETTFEVRLEDFALDKSLTGEFVRMIMAADDIPDEDKATVIRYGIQAINGEDIA